MKRGARPHCVAQRLLQSSLAATPEAMAEDLCSLLSMMDAMQLFQGMIYKLWQFIPNC